MTPDEWAKWKSNRTTVKFFKYVEDFRKQIAINAAELIAEGVEITPEKLQNDTIQCQALCFVEDLTFDEIDAFYNPEKEEEDDDHQQ